MVFVAMLLVALCGIVVTMLMPRRAAGHEVKAIEGLEAMAR